MALDIFDPSIPSGKTSFSYAPRPKTLRKLKVGLVDNSKHNSKALLLRIADRLNERYGMEVGHLITKLSPGHAVSEADIEAFKKTVNVGVAGIGD